MSFLSRLPRTLVAAVLMLTLSSDDGAGFRWMVTALVILGMIGFQLASGFTRRLSRTLVALTGEGG